MKVYTLISQTSFVDFMPFNIFALPALAALIVEIVVFALLLKGYWLNRKLEFPRHGKIMSRADILHVIAIASVMIPSFVLAIIHEYIIPNFAGIVSILTLIHVPFGIAAVSLGVWFAISWRQKGLQGCFKKKRLMLITFIMWIGTLFLGIVLFAILNVPLLLG